MLFAMAAMRIQVVGEDAITAQARTYAEYRLFAALSRSAERVRSARVLLRSLDGHSSSERVVCVVTITFDGTGSLRIRSTGARAYAAIDRAVDRVRLATGSAFPETISS